MSSAADGLRYSRALDGLRALSVLAIIGYHLNYGWALGSYLAVDLFFVLSGFLITSLLISEHARSQTIKFRDFFARRARRLLPALFVIIAFVAALNAWVLDPVQRTTTRNDELASLFYVANWRFIAQGESYFDVFAAPSPVRHLWTLAIEAQFYLLLPLLARAFARRPLAGALLAFAVAALWRYGAAHDLEPLVRLYSTLGAHWRWPEEVIRRLLATQLPAYLAHFAIGGLLGHWWLAHRAVPPAGARRVGLALGSLAALAALAMFLGGRATWGEHTWIVTTACLAMLLYGAARGDGPVAGWLMARGALAFAGKVSYSGYLYHLPLLLVAIELWPGAAPGLLPGYLAVAIAAAWVSWRCVEQRYVRDRVPTASAKTMAVV